MKTNQKDYRRRKKIVYDVIRHKDYVPMNVKEIAMLLDIPKKNREQLEVVLKSLEVSGNIEKKENGKYVKSSKKKTEKRKPSKVMTGTFIAHPNGFGFVELEEEDSEDLYIPADYVNGALHKDIVEVSILPFNGGKRREGEITKIVERGMEEVIGTYQKRQNFGFVVPDNKRYGKDIFIPKDKENGALDEDKVVVKIIKYPKKSNNPEGVVKEILGNKDAVGIDVLSIARGYDLPIPFPDKVLNQASKVKQYLIEGDFQGRKDIRDWQTVTIDGEDAKDLDDAISLTKEDDIYRLGVHIADVSNYVQYNSALDREALKRGTSVYLVDRVIPMLPKTLSNGICSLNQGEDRLALSCIMDVNAQGRVIDYEIVETVICVDRRMTYTNVKKILVDEDEAVKKEYEEFVPMFERMRELSKAIRSRRSHRGSIDFDFPESKILLDENGKPIEIYAYEHNVATDIIEDFMLLANETIAAEFCKAEIPFVYRSHENPDPEKIEKALTVIRGLGFKVEKMKEEITPKEIQKIMTQITGTPQEALISRMLLRSMKQAKYTTVCGGHFGLAAGYYCHFTSPIRRYPDLQIHRIIKDTLRNRMSEEKKKSYEEILEDVAKQSSSMERRSEEVERETIKLKKAEYMQSYIGEKFTGVISGVTAFGFYVELPNTVEGMVHVNRLIDYYEYDEQHQRLVGEVSGKVYALGDTVDVVLKEVNMEAKTIDFDVIH